MTNNEAAKWIQLYIDLAKIDPTTGEAAYLNDDDKKIIEAMEMAISALARQTALKEKCLTCEHCERCDSELANNSPKVDSDFGDLISRQVANAAICSACGMIDCDQMDKCKKLFTVQPDSKETSSTHKALDTISRQAAIDAIPQRIKGVGGESWMMTYRRSGYNDCVDACLDAIWNLPSAQPVAKDINVLVKDCISRQAVIEINRSYHGQMPNEVNHRIWKEINELSSAQPTLYGYNIEHLELIARVLKKEDLPPERVAEFLTDICRIVAIVRDEIEETLRKAVEQCMT